MAIIQESNAFAEELVRRFRPMIVRLAASITQDSFHAEDIAQEVLMILIRKQNLLKGFSIDGTSNYIYVVTRNYSLKFLQKKSREIITFCDPVDLNHIEGEPNLTIFAQDYGYSDRTIEILQLLSSQERKLIDYRYGEGYSFNEIETITGVPSVTLRKRMQRCKAKLKLQFWQEKKNA